MPASPSAVKGLSPLPQNLPSALDPTMSGIEKKEAGSTPGDGPEEIQVAEKTAPKKREYKDFEHEKQEVTRMYLFSPSCAQAGAHHIPRLQTPMSICPR